MMAGERNVTYRFDEFVLEPARGTLRGPGGADLALRPKALALLTHLLENPGHLLRREDLLETLWPGVVVTDDSLTQCISDLRHAFGVRATQVLRTVPRRGYVLTAEVRRTGEEPTQSRKVADLRAERTIPIVVTALDHPGGDAASSHLAHALSNDLVTELATFEEVRAVPTTHPHVGRAFRLCGEVRPAGSSLRVSLRLESAAGAALWADRINVPQGDRPELDEAHIGKLAVTLVREMNTEGLREARSTPDAQRTPRQLCLLAREHHQHATEHDTQVARTYLERAIALDPDYAPAYAWLCYVVQRALTQGWGDMDGETAREKALEFARRAVQLEPSSPLCLARFAYALMLHGRWEEAIATARGALNARRHPTWESRMTAGETLGCCGCHADAVEALRKALAEDPLCPPAAHAVLGRSLLLAGQTDEALVELQLCRARLPAYLPCLQSLVVAAAEAGHVELAADAFLALQRHHPWWTTASSRGHWLVRYASEDERFRKAFLATAELAGAGRQGQGKTVAG